MNQGRKGLKKRALQSLHTIKEKIAVLTYASRDPAIPMAAKVITLIALAYALSPVDLIPDFIPVLGYLDDLIILPLLFTAAWKLIPSEVIQRAQEQVASQPIELKKNWISGVFIILLWTAVIAWAGYALYRRSHF